MPGKGRPPQATYSDSFIHIDLIVDYIQCVYFENPFHTYFTIWNDTVDKSWKKYDLLIREWGLYGMEPLQRRHNECHGISKHRHLVCLFSRLFRRTSKKISKLRVTGICERNPPIAGGFPLQRASNVENVTIWRRHHELSMAKCVAAPWLPRFMRCYFVLIVGPNNKCLAETALN